MSDRAPRNIHRLGTVGAGSATIVSTVLTVAAIRAGALTSAGALLAALSPLWGYLAAAAGAVLAHPTDQDRPPDGEPRT